MTGRETIAPGRGTTIAFHQGGTHTESVTIGGEVAVTVVVAVGAGARIAPEIGTENATGIEKETVIAAEVGLTAELDPEAGVEVRSRFNEKCTCFYSLSNLSTSIKV